MTSVLIIFVFSSSPAFRRPVLKPPSDLLSFSILGGSHPYIRVISVFIFFFVSWLIFGLISCVGLCNSNDYGYVYSYV